MNYADIKRVDVANGPGVRVSLFVSGCRRHCRECFNPETWSFAYGTPYTQETENMLLSLLAPDHIKGLSLLGGEPLEPENYPTLLRLVRRVKTELPQKTVWCYSGSTLETEILPAAQKDETLMALLKCIDVLVDGAFVIEQKSLKTRFRGSANQRLIDLPRTLETGAVVLWDE